MDNLRLAIINHIEDLKADLELEKMKILALQAEAEKLNNNRLISFHNGRRGIIQREINTLLGLLEETA